MTVLYSKIRDEIRTGDLLAWKTTRINSFFDFVLFLYQKILKAEFTHVGIAFKEGDRLFLIEATPPAVRIYPVSMTDDFYVLFNNIETRPSHIDLLLKNVGKKYSLFDLLRSILKLGNSTSEYYCSELAAMYYNSIGFIHDIDAGLTPDSIIKAIANETKSKPLFVKNDRGNLTEV